MNMNAITRIGGKALLKVRKHSPAILLAVGIGGVVAGAVMACKATTHVEELNKKTHEELDKVDLLVKPRKIDYAKVYAKCGLEYIKLYGPAVAVGGAGIACLIGSHGILNRRYLGTTAAYGALQEAYTRYQNNVRAAVGDEVEKNIRLGLTEKDDIPVEETNEEGEVLISPTKGVIVNPSLCASPYAVFFDESAAQWTKNPEFNKMTLTALQNVANDMFKAQGHLFLNEVYDMLGVPRTQAGAVVGWLKGAGDDYVDFGIFNAFSEKARDFVNGYERSILLDFNVDGVIYDKI